jgi:hypothetical protein
MPTHLSIEVLPKCSIVFSLVGNGVEHTNHNPQLSSLFHSPPPPPKSLSPPHQGADAAHNEDIDRGCRDDQRWVPPLSGRPRPRQSVDGRRHWLSQWWRRSNKGGDARQRNFDDSIIGSVVDYAQASHVKVDEDHHGRIRLRFFFTFSFKILFLLWDSVYN